MLMNSLKPIFQAVLISGILISTAFGQDLELNGYIRTYLGILTNETMDYSIVQNTLDLKLKRSMDRVAMSANPYIYQYPDQDPKLGMREAYMDIFFDKMDLRLGKQQIIWGKADGVFITDIVSPKDLSEFLLRDFEEIRTGITAMKADYYIGNNTLEFVWIPEFTPTIMPDTSSIWSRIPTFSLPVTIDNANWTVPDKLENSEAFVKFSGMSSLLDYELIAGSMWDDDPTIHVAPVMENGNPQPVGFTIMPEHHRLTLAGGSISTEIAGYILRSEAAYYVGKQFVSSNAQGLPINLLEKDYLHYLAGTDFSIKGTNISAQFIQQVIIDYKYAIVKDEVDNTVTLLANRTFLQETLTLQAFAYIGLNSSDALIRPTIIYDFADGFEIVTGVNIFMQKDTDDPGIFGYYDQNDMAYVKVKYSF
ncbi:MAG: hypothetical protein HN590_16060 [Calditrichaeota bacterium]|jgi:hypothetical protein|nr:hypothetical protein [Calditrichota bacterium]